MKKPVSMIMLLLVFSIISFMIFLILFFITNMFKKYVLQHKITCFF